MENTAYDCTWNTCVAYDHIIILTVLVVDIINLIYSFHFFH